MSFSERMKESLGVEGARVEVAAPGDPIAAGGQAPLMISIVGGTQSAQIDNLMLRLIESRRHWRTPDGQVIAEEEAQAHPDRRQLMPTWSRRIVAEDTMQVGHLVEAGENHQLDIPLALPADCGATTPACVITVNAQADIKGQIDPTGTATLTIAAAPS
jgi:sporulation-control protein spo0M